MDDRVTELECRVALQEDQLEGLTQQLMRQQQALDALQVKVQYLQEQLKTLRSPQIATPQEDNAPPPHY